MVFENILFLRPTLPNLSMHILIIDKMHPSLMPMLAAKGHTADYDPDITRAEITDRIAGYDGIIVRSKTTIDRELLQHATRLKFIARAGAGLDLIDLQAIAEGNIQLFNAPEGNRDAVAEHAVGMLLCLMNGIHLADRQVRNRIWDREGNRGVELKGRTVGIIGYGNTGREFARRIRAFGCEVLAYDKYLKNFSDEYARESTLDGIFGQAQVVSLHVPLTPETNRWFAEPVFSRFRHGFFLINTSRGEVLPLADLRRAVEAGIVRGACLDVLENEKLGMLTAAQREAFDWLSQSDRVLFTPHVAGWTHESYVKINEVLVDKITAASYFG